MAEPRKQLQRELDALLVAAVKPAGTQASAQKAVAKAAQAAVEKAAAAEAA